MGLRKAPGSKITLTLVGAFLLAACETQPTHEVLAVSDISPRQIEVGDRVIVQGTGFPQASDIRRITLRLGGSLARPGARPCGRSVALTLTDPPLDQRVIDPATGLEREPTYASAQMHTLRIESGSRLEFTVTDAILRALMTCPGEREASSSVSHATLALLGASGGVSVRIETLQGTTLASSRAMRGPRLDLLAPFARGLDVEIAARAAAEHTLDGMGLRLASVHPPEGGLQVERVTPGAPADEAGIVDGDVLERIDGVTILGASDFRTAPGADVSVVTVRRGDSMDEHPVRVAAVTRGAPSDLPATAVVLLVAVALVGLSATRRRGFLAWLGAVWRGRDAPVAAHEEGADGAFFNRVRRRVNEVAERDPALVAMLCAAVGTVALSVPFGPMALRVDFDVISAHVLGALASVLVGSAWTSAGREKTARIVALGRRLAPEVVGLLPLAAVVTLAGEIRVQSIVGAQGGACWQWNLFHDPVVFTLGAVALAGVAFQSDVVTSDGAPRVLRVVAATVLVERAALLAALFLGGASLPGVTQAAQESSVALQMLGAALFTMKAWGLALAVQLGRGALSRLHVERRRWLVWAWLLPVSAVCAALVVGGVALAGIAGPAREVLVRVTAWTTFGVIAIAGGVRALAREEKFR